MKLTKYNEEQVKQWHKDYLSGLRKTEIEKKYNVCTRTINPYFEKYNLKYDWTSFHLKSNKKELEKYKKAAKFYQEGYTLRESIKKANLAKSRTSLTTFLRKEDIAIRTFKEAKSKVKNHNFFSKIDTEIKAYLLGFFAADGSLSKRTNSDLYYLKIGLQKRDLPILHLYNKHIADNNIAITVPKPNVVSIAFNSKQLGEDLLNLGFPINKTREWDKLPNLPENMYPHFIRGFFDGDGSVSVNFRTKEKRINGLSCRCSFACYSKKVLQEIQKKIGVPFHITLRKGGERAIRGVTSIFSNFWVIEAQKKEYLKTIHNYLYSNATYFFYRKKHTFDLALLNYNQYIATLQGNL